MQLIVFGASGPTGRLVVRRALAAGHGVTAVTRKPADYPPAPALSIAEADVGDTDAVARAVAGGGAVISVFGVPYSRKPISVYSTGVGNIVAAMRAHDLARLVGVSSTTVAGAARSETWWWRNVVIPALRHVVGRTLYDDMARMEAIVHASGLNWTIVRPGGLFDIDAPSGTAEVATHRLPGRFTARADLAQALIAEATAPRHLRATVEVITRSAPPSPLRTFLREAFKI